MSLSESISHIWISCKTYIGHNYYPLIMREVNILSIIEAFRSLDKSLFKKYTESQGITSGIKDYELAGLESLAQQLLLVNKDISVLQQTVYILYIV